MTLKLARQKTVYLLAAVFISLLLLGTPLVAQPIYAGDCPTVSGGSC